MAFNIPHGEWELQLSPEFTPTIVDIDSSESEVEVVSVKLTPEQENQKMKGEERYGFLYRVEDRQQAVDERLRGIVEDIKSERPEVRKARRDSFQKAIFGDIAR